MRSLVALFLIAGTALFAPVATAADAPSVAQFLKVRTPGTPVLLPDGSLLLRDWPDGVWQLYRVTPKAPGPNASYAPGEVVRTQLTNFPDGVSSFSLARRQTLRDRPCARRRREHAALAN